MRVAISDEQRQEIIRRYVAGDRPKNIAIAMGINDWNVSVIARRAGYARSRVDAQQLILVRDEWIGNRQYTVDHRAFSTITPDSAYWCGFLMADGNISGNKVALKLATRDVGHIEKFRTFVGANSPVRVDGPREGATINGRDIKNTGSVSITAASSHLVKDLLALGVTPRKSLTAHAGGNVEFNVDFWRGVIDGNGSLVYSKGKPYLGLVGSGPLMTQFLAFCKTRINNEINVRPNGNIFKVFMNCRAARIMISTLYSGCGVALERKLRKAEFILEMTKHYG